LEVHRQEHISCKQQLAAEQAANSSIKDYNRELKQRLWNLRASAAVHSRHMAAVVASTKAEQEKAVAAAVATAASEAGTAAAATVAQQLADSRLQMQQLRHHLTAESATSRQLQATVDDMRKRLANLQVVTSKHAAVVEDVEQSHNRAAAPPAAAALQSSHQRVQVDSVLLNALKKRSKQLKQLKQQHEEQLQQVKQQLAVAQANAADVLSAAEAASTVTAQEHQQQLQQLRLELVGYVARAAAAKAAEQAAKEQAEALQAQLGEQHAVAASQQVALAAINGQIDELRHRAAATGEHGMSHWWVGYQTTGC